MNAPIRRWLLAPVLHSLSVLINQGNSIMSAFDDLKAADARFNGIAAAAVQRITGLRAENTALRAQVADLTAKLAAVPDESGIEAVATDLNAGADALNAAVNP